MLIAGDLVYPAGMAHEVLARYAAWAVELPEEMASAVVLANAAAHFALPELRGRPAVVVRACFDGTDEQGQALVDPWRHWAQPVADRFGPRSAADVVRTASTPVDGSGHVVTSDRLTGLTDDAIGALCAAVLPAEDPPMLLAAELRHLVSRRDDPGGHRSDLLLLLIGDGRTPDAAAHARRRLGGVRRDLAELGVTSPERTGA